MSGKVWMSSVFSNRGIGERLGTRTKNYGRDWDPASKIVPVATEEELEALRKYTKGFPLQRTDFPEADAVFNEKAFSRVGDLCASAGFFVVKGKLAEVLSQFDLGEGGLIPFTIYKAGLATPVIGEFFLLNFGARKNSILPEECEDARKFYVDKNSGQQIWDINYLNPDGEVALSPTANHGPDLWFEEAVHNRIFISDRLAKALIDIGMKEVFKLKECRIVESVH